VVVVRRSKDMTRIATQIADERRAHRAGERISVPPHAWMILGR